MARPVLEDPFATDRLNDVSDFVPEWDVPTLGRAFTDSFSAAVTAVRSKSGLDAERKIHAFLGSPGYGKTHLFGRIHHQQKEQVHFVFLQAVDGVEGVDKARQLESVLRWHLVEALLYSPTTFAPLNWQLAKLLVASFRAYFGSKALDTKFKERCSGLVAELGREDPLAVLDVFGKVDGIGAYHLLADALRARMPHCSGPVLRALVLGASPAADDARWWLRGEADQLPADRLAALRLPDESPPLIDILRTVAELLRVNKMPLVLCIDQIDPLFKTDRTVFTALTNQIMTWLQTVPNLLMAVGALEGSWKAIEDDGGFQSFTTRTVKHLLPPLSGEVAVGLLRARMESWTEYEPKREPGWPFDLESVKRLVDRDQHSPRSFLQMVCEPRFRVWRTGKRQDKIVIEDNRIEIVDVRELFKQVWAKKLEEVKASNKTATNAPDHDLWAAVEEALNIAAKAKYPADGPNASKIDLHPINRSPNDQRPSARLALTDAGGKSVLVAVSKRDGGGGVRGVVRRPRTSPHQERRGRSGGLAAGQPVRR